MAFALSSYYDKPIPLLDKARAAKIGYRAWPLNHDNPYNQERLVDVKQYGFAGENLYFEDDNPPYHEHIPNSIPDLLLRKTVADKLLRVNGLLGTGGLELYVFDGYRPIEVQNYFHDEWFPNYLRPLYPDLSRSQLQEEVERYWAEGAESATSQAAKNSPPPHATGSAVDLTIRKKRTHQHLYMGSIVDDVTPLAYTDHFEKCKPRSVESFSDAEARKCRRLLYWLMSNEGFVNNPTEWWHYSWGDQMWAKLSGQNAAFYSIASV